MLREPTAHDAATTGLGSAEPCARLLTDTHLCAATPCRTATLGSLRPSGKASAARAPLRRLSLRPASKAAPLPALHAIHALHALPLMPSREALRPPALPASLRPPPSPSITVRPAAPRITARPPGPRPSQRPAAARISMRPLGRRSSLRPPAKRASSRITRLRFAIAFACCTAGATPACMAQTADGSSTREAELVASPVVGPAITAPGGKACPGATTDAVEVRDAISRVRAMVGLPAVDCATPLATAAGAHASYLAQNGEFGHTESKGRPGFTGASVGDRVGAAKFDGETDGEVLSSQVGAASIDSEFGYLNSVYHRAMLLRIETTTYGYGSSSAGSVIDLGRPDDAHQQAQRVVWPPDGATNVPTTFHSASETPNPVAPLQVAGSPISLVTGHALVAVVGVLMGPEGPVDAVLITSKNDPAKLVRTSEAHLVPKQPLAPNTTYVAHFGFLDASQAVTLKTTFTTGAH